MIVVFSEHADEQIKRRRIPKRRVSKTVSEPDQILPSFRGRELRRKRFRGKILEVATKVEGAIVVVITAYYLKEEK